MFLVVLLVVIPPKPSNLVVATLLSPILDHFQYDEMVENNPVHIKESMKGEGKRYIFASQPHGLVPFCGIAHQIKHARLHMDEPLVKTAVASRVLLTPLLKQVMGLLNCIPASRKSLTTTLEDESIRLYVGGTSEVFYNTSEKEFLHLTKHKGFIKLALQTGVDIVPAYEFGNSSIFQVYKHSMLIKLSKVLQLPVTYFWGSSKLLPFIPKPRKLLHITGQPLGMPHIPRPRPNHIDEWHKKYVFEVSRIFEAYKERHPDYKHKQLVII